jgi:hypothetical protein
MQVLARKFLFVKLKFTPDCESPHKLVEKPGLWEFKTGKELE